MAVLRHWRRHRLQILLSLAGVAIGVAVVVAVDLASASAEREFERANRAVDGIASHRVSGVSAGVDERLFARLKVDLGIRDAAPVVRGEGRHGGRTVTVMGLDPLSDWRLRDFGLRRGGNGSRPFAAFVSEAFTARHGLEPGSPLALSYGDRHVTFHVAGTLSGVGAAIPDDLVVTDIAAAQVFLGMTGRLSHIDLNLEDGADADAVRAMLPAGVHLVDTGGRNRARFAMTRAFRINLAALGLLAMVIALFLIHNTVAFQAVRRRPLFALLRAVGVTPNGVATCLLAEAAVIAAAGVALGVTLGVFLSRFLYGMVTGTIDALYFDLGGAQMAVAPLTLAKSALVGFGATLLAAALPALEARRVPPRGLMIGPAGRWHGARRRHWLTFAVIALAVSAAVYLLGGDSLVAAFAALFLLILGAAALSPAAVVALARLLEAPARASRAPALIMAVRGLTAHLGRTGTAVAALAVAVAASLGVSLMIDSFRTSVTDWLDGYLRADIYISAVDRAGPGLDADFIAALGSLPGVTAVSLGRRFTAEDPVHGPLEIFVLDTTPEGFAGFQIKSGDADDLWRRFSRGGEVLVSEPFARRFDLSPADMFTLATDRGTAELEVAAVYYDYSSDRGVMAMSPATFERYFEPRPWLTASLHVDEDAPGGTTAALSAFESGLNGDGSWFARSNRDLRDASLVVFDRTFQVTGILRILAVIVAVTGIITALMALELERSREYATLRAVGVTRGALAAQVLAQTTLTGLAAGLIALPMGVALCVVLIEVINVRSFGWSMQTVVDPGLLLATLLVAVGAAFVAGIYPAWRLRSIAVAEGLRHD